MDLYLKPDWPETQARLLRWWQHQGLAVCLLNRRARTQPPLLPPAAPADEYTHWIDPTYRLALAEYEQAAYEYLAEAFPYFETQIGPGSLGAMLGAGVILDPATVWYRPCILDPEAYGVIKFQSKNNPWWETHRAMLAAGRQYFGSRIPVGIPDLIEGLDTLSAMRGEMNLLFDLKERPAWVHARLAEINQAYFEVYELIYAMIKGPDDSRD